MIRTFFQQLRKWHTPKHPQQPRPRPCRLEVERLEDRVTPNSAWGWNGPPLALTLPIASPHTQTPVTLNGSGDAAGSASITSSNEVDYYRFTPAATGFFHLTVTTPTATKTRWDAMIGVYSGETNKLLGYKDSISYGKEDLLVYLEAGKTYYMGITNFQTGRKGTYTWTIDDVDTAPGNPTVPDGARVLYVNFDGANLDAAALRTWDNDWQYGTATDFDPANNGVHIDPFLSSVSWDTASDREAIIDQIMGYLAADLAPFGVLPVRWTGTAVAGQGATTIFVGPSTLEDLAANDPNRGYFHVAGDIDVGNNNLTDIAFVYDENWGTVSATSLALADVILHEAGHTFGLFHVNTGDAAAGGSPETMGLRYSTPNQTNWLVNTGYLNQSFLYREFSGSQDSYQTVARAFGVRTDLPPVPAGATLNNNFRDEDHGLFHANGVGDQHEGELRFKLLTSEEATVYSPAPPAAESLAGRAIVVGLARNDSATGPLATAAPAGRGTHAQGTVAAPTVPTASAVHSTIPRIAWSEEILPESTLQALAEALQAVLPELLPVPAVAPETPDEELLAAPAVVWGVDAPTPESLASAEFSTTMAASLGDGGKDHPLAMLAALALVLNGACLYSPSGNVANARRQANPVQGARVE